MGGAFVANERSYEVPERPVLAVCADGWDPGYVDDVLERGLMPRLSEALSNGGGTYVIGRAQVPTFTNPNNAAIVTGVSAAHNGIAGNHYRDQAGHEVQVTTDPSFLRASTIHAAACAAGVPAACRRSARSARTSKRCLTERRSSMSSGSAPGIPASTTGSCLRSRSTSPSRSR